MNADKLVSIFYKAVDSVDGKIIAEENKFHPARMAGLNFFVKGF
jgi:hypothetical protein